MARAPRFGIPKFRILPLFILVGALMFGARVGSLWQIGTGHAPPEAPPEPPVFSQAFAQSASAAAPAAAPEPAQPLPGLSGQAAYSQSEIEVLQNLAARRAELDKRERELDQRLAVLSAAEAQIDAKIQKLREIQTTIEGLIEKHDDQENQKIENLVKIYTAMKPKDAARIFEQMDMPILIQVIKGMKERVSAAILSNMSPDRANAVTTELATQSRLPADLVGDTGVKR
jgi:flagellar motility protein MotE (MotC chaperone)